jgi:hypothetical protein
MENIGPVPKLSSVRSSNNVVECIERGRTALVWDPCIRPADRPLGAREWSECVSVQGPKVVLSEK